MDAPSFDVSTNFNFEEGAMNTPSLGSLVGGTAALVVTAAAAAEIGKKGGNAIYNKTANLFKEGGN